MTGTAFAVLVPSEDEPNAKEIIITVDADKVGVIGSDIAVADTGLMVDFLFLETTDSARQEIILANAGIGAINSTIASYEIIDFKEGL